MSQSTNKETVIGTYKIGMSDDFKATIANMQAAMQAATSALRESNKSRAATASFADVNYQAANDAPNPELKQIGQWVFEGEDSRWKSAAVDKSGRAYLYLTNKSGLKTTTEHWRAETSGCIYVGDGFDASNWAKSAINRETINDVDYLSGHEMPVITQDDMQLVFIKNMATRLIQRMHSMNRFSEDDYHIGGDNLMAWDIIVNDVGDFAIVTGHNQTKRYFGVILLEPQEGGVLAETSAQSLANSWLEWRGFCTITESQLSDFRLALEACYA